MKQNSPQKSFTLTQKNYLLYVLGLVAMLGIGYGQLLNYFPGLDDIPLLMQSLHHTSTEWFTLGYHDWMDTRPDVITEEMYEVRPLTHLYSRTIWWITGGNTAWNPLFMIAGGFWVTLTLVKLCRAHGLQTWAIAAVCLVFWVANPTRPDGIYQHLAFMQVSFAFVAFGWICIYAVRQQFIPIIAVLLLSTMIKESTFYFGLLAGVIWALSAGKLSRNALALIAIHAFAFAAVRVLSHLEGITHIVAAVSSDQSASANIANILFEAVRSMAYLPFFIPLSATPFPAFIWVPILLSSWALMAWLSLGAAKHIQHGRAFIGALWTALVAFYLFHDSLRWGWEFSAMLSISLVVMVAHASNWQKVMAVAACSLWLISGLEQTRDTFRSGSAIFGGQLDKLVYGEYIRALQYADERGIKNVYVLNDPTYINPKYVAAFAGVSFTPKISTEVFLDYFFEQPQGISDIAIHQNGLLVKTASTFVEGVAIEEKHTVLERPWPTAIPGGNVAVSTSEGLTTVITETLLPPNHALIMYDPGAVSFLLLIPNDPDGEWSLFTRNPLSRYLPERTVNVACSDIARVYVNNMDSSSVDVPAQEFFSDETGNRREDAEEGRCRLKLSPNEYARSHHQLVLLGSDDQPIEMLPVPPFPRPAPR